MKLSINYSHFTSFLLCRLQTKNERESEGDDNKLS